MQQPQAEKSLTLSICSDPSEVKVWATPPGRPPTHGKVIAGATTNVERTGEEGAHARGRAQFSIPTSTAAKGAIVHLTDFLLLRFP